MSDLESLKNVDLDLNNLLMSFGVTAEDAEKIDNLIDSTIQMNIKLGGAGDDLSVHGDSRER